MRRGYTAGVSGLAASRILETVFGLSVIYVVLALFCSAANEWISTLLRLRARMLRGALGTLWREDALGAAFYAHPLVRAFIRAGGSAAYLPAHVFSRTLIDLLITDFRGEVCFDDPLEAVQSLPCGELRTSLLALLRHTNGEREQARKILEAWFDEAMVCASTRYKRRVYMIMFALAAVCAVALNADTLRMIDCFHSASSDPVLGWNSGGSGSVEWLSRIAGWLLTAAAVSLGAPFWFDVLGRVARVRPQGRAQPGSHAA